MKTYLALAWLALGLVFFALGETTNGLLAAILAHLVVMEK